MRIIEADRICLLPPGIEQDCNCVVLDKNGGVIDMGRRPLLQEKYADAVYERYRGAILPGLVNAHCHLELSAYSSTSRPQAGTPFTAWVEQLMAERTRCNFSEELLCAAATEMARRQYNDGVVLIGDIANALPSSHWLEGEAAVPEVVGMLEIIAPVATAVEAAEKRIAALPETCHLTAHAPYSVAPELLVALKKRCRRNGQLFSIHTSETKDELEFLSRHSGIFRDFLEKRHAWDGSFTRCGRFPSAVQYFSALNLLDDQTLLVHCTNLIEEDFPLLERSGAHVCLCPSSNRWLGVGQSDAVRLAESIGGRLCLGTDSITSNPDLDIWQEMCRLSDQGITPSRILLMATEGG
ncbi:amidohydrolase family protein, partial [Desulforhopalus vacuolatus]|uniref:amidohydrolase family protein n=1 Tax=Desulforhopalus vacuolatus TaxID=40414 RepID=UPI0019656FBD